MAALLWAMPGISDEERGRVEEELRRRDLPPRLRERLEMVKAAALGREMTEIVRWSGRSPGTIRFWLDRFVAVGVSGLADAPRPGRPARADAAYLEALERAVETPPRDLGFPFDVWTSARLSAYLAETTAVRIAPGWLRALLARRDFVSGRPKHTLKHLQDAAEVAACKAELTEAGEKGSRRAGPVRAALRG
jgi:transposase